MIQLLHSIGYRMMRTLQKSKCLMFFQNRVPKSPKDEILGNFADQSLESRFEGYSLQEDRYRSLKRL